MPLPNRLLISNICLDDDLFVKAAKGLGIEVVATCIDNDDSTITNLHEHYKDLQLVTIKTAYQRRCSVWLGYLLIHILTRFFQIKTRAWSTIRTARSLGYSSSRAFLGLVFPWLRPHIRVATKYWDKELYLKDLSAAGLPVPTIYLSLKGHEDPEVLPENLEYPCICKPAHGTGGMGVLVAYSEDDIKRLFSYETRTDIFDSVDLFYRNRTKKGLRNYVYNSGVFGGPYFIQQFIDGRIFSISGAVIKGQTKSTFCYEIHPTPNQYCAELGFSWPIETDIQSKMVQLSEKIVRVLKYPDGPFMVDFVMSNDGKLYIIDAALRASLTAARMSYWVYQNNHHTENLLSSHWGALLHALTEESIGRPIYWQRLPFPKGKYKSVDYPNFNQPQVIYTNILVNNGTVVNEPRQDRQVAARGSLATTGSTLDEARKNWEKLFAEIKWELEKNI